MPIEWTDEQIERAAHAFKETTEYDISPYSEDNYIHAMSAALAALAPDIQAHIAAEVVALKAENARLRAVLTTTHEWLGDPRLSTWKYMESSEFYMDKSDIANEIRMALATPGGAT